MQTCILNQGLPFIAAVNQFPQQGFCYLFGSIFCNRTTQRVL